MTDLFQHSGWLFDLLDVAVVAYLVYQFLLLIKGTVTFRVVVVLGCLFLIYAGSHVTGLKTVNWVLSNIFGSLIILLAIIFQHDLRRALVVISRKAADPAGKGEGLEVIEELVTAAESLASRSIGALMVVERDMPLDAYLAVGTDIDAKVASELLTSIFLPYSPIHDGAVIIQRGKITKAGCFLPLAQNPEISKSLGTRHRAAIGISEIVDAVAIVVSEETGKIAVAIGGGIIRDLDAAGLRKVLKRLLEARWLQ